MGGSAATTSVQTAAPARPARPLRRRRRVGALGGGGRGLRRHLFSLVYEAGWVDRLQRPQCRRPRRRGRHGLYDGAAESAPWAAADEGSAVTSSLLCMRPDGWIGCNDLSADGRAGAAGTASTTAPPSRRLGRRRTRTPPPP